MATIDTLNGGWTFLSASNYLSYPTMPNSIALSDINLPEHSEVIDLLKRCPDIQALRFVEEEYLIREGDSSMNMFLVIEGAFVVEQEGSLSEGGRPRILGRAVSDPYTPIFVGEMAYLGGGFRAASIRSSGRTDSLALNPEHLDSIIEEFPALTRSLCKQFTQRLSEANQMINEYQNLLKMETEQLFLEKDAVLFNQGSQPEKLFQLVQGKLVSEKDGVIKQLAAWDCPKGLIEPAAFLRGDPWPVTVKTETPAAVVAISGDSKLAVIRNFPELVADLLK